MIGVGIAGCGQSEHLHFFSLRAIDTLVNRERRPIDSTPANAFEKRVQDGMNQIPSLNETIFNLENSKAIYNSFHKK